MVVVTQVDDVLVRLETVTLLLVEIGVALLGDTEIEELATLEDKVVGLLDSTGLLLIEIEVTLLINADVEEIAVHWQPMNECSPTNPKHLR